MSSSLSPTTSTKVAISPRKEKRTSSFPSFSSLNPFRDKSSEESLPFDPILVAPGIWSTDATAEVFGYVQTDARGRRRFNRSQSAGPYEKRRGSLTHSRQSLRRERSFVGSYKEVEKDRSTKDLSDRKRQKKRKYQELAGRKGIDVGQSEIESGRWQSSRGSMRTVSQDDRLTERGANPRTGLVSPYVTSDGSADALDAGYFAKGLAKSPLSGGSRRTSSGRWKQSGGSWSFVQERVTSPTKMQKNENPSPKKLQNEDKPVRPVSVQKIEDRLLAQMPGVDNPEPENMSNEQIRRYQQSVVRACDVAGGAHAMVNPETLPTPRQTSPVLDTEGPRTPPRNTHTIKRKEVGSSMVAENSEDTIVVHRTRQSTSDRPPPVRMPSSDRQKVRIMSPSMAALGAAPRTPLDVESSFLGPRQRSPQTASAGRFLSRPPLSPATNQQERLPQAHYPAQTQDPSAAPSAPPVSSPTLSQFLPRAHFLPPTHFANLGSAPSHPRPPRILPPSLRSGPQKRQLVEDAATITTITTSTGHRQGPGMPRSGRAGGRAGGLKASRHHFESRPRCRNQSPQPPLPMSSDTMPALDSPTMNTGRVDNSNSNAYPRGLPYPSGQPQQHHHLNDGSQSATVSIPKYSHHYNHHTSQSRFSAPAPPSPHAPSQAPPPSAPKQMSSPASRHPKPTIQEQTTSQHIAPSSAPADTVGASAQCLPHRCHDTATHPCCSGSKECERQPQHQGQPTLPQSLSPGAQIALSTALTCEGGVRSLGREAGREKGEWEGAGLSKEASTGTTLTPDPQDQSTLVGGSGRGHVRVGTPLGRGSEREIERRSGPSGMMSEVTEVGGLPLMLWAGLGEGWMSEGIREGGRSVIGHWADGKVGRWSAGVDDISGERFSSASTVVSDAEPEDGVTTTGEGGSEPRKRWPLLARGSRREGRDGRSVAEAGDEVNKENEMRAGMDNELGMQLTTKGCVALAVRIVVHMVRHVVRTLHPSSPAVLVLIGGGDYDRRALSGEESYAGKISHTTHTILANDSSPTNKRPHPSNTATSWTRFVAAAEIAQALVYIFLLLNLAGLVVRLVRQGLRWGMWGVWVVGWGWWV